MEPWMVTLAMTLVLNAAGWAIAVVRMEARLSERIARIEVIVGRLDAHVHRMANLVQGARLQE